MLVVNFPGSISTVFLLMITNYVLALTAEICSTSRKLAFFRKSGYRLSKITDEKGCLKLPLFVSKTRGNDLSYGMRISADFFTMHASNGGQTDGRMD